MREGVDLQLCPAAAVVQADSGAARRGALHREGTHSEELVALACTMGTRRVGIGVGVRVR